MKTKTIYQQLLEEHVHTLNHCDFFVPLYEGGRYHTYKDKQMDKLYQNSGFALKKFGDLSSELQDMIRKNISFKITGLKNVYVKKHLL